MEAEFERLLAKANDLLSGRVGKDGSSTYADMYAGISRVFGPSLDMFGGAFIRLSKQRALSLTEKHSWLGPKLAKRISFKVIGLAAFFHDASPSRQTHLPRIGSGAHSP